MPEGTAGSPAAGERPTGRFAAALGRVAEHLPLLSGILIALALSLGAWSLTLLRHTTLNIERNHRLTIGLEQVLSTLKDIETGARGFLLTGQDSFLEPYNAASATIEGSLEAVEASGIDMSALRAAVAERRRSAADLIAIYRAVGPDHLREHVTFGVGKAAMDRARAVVAQGQEAAGRRIDEDQRLQMTVAWPMAIFSVGLILAAFGLIAMLAVRRLREQRASEQRFRTLTEASAAIIWTASPAGTFTAPQPGWTAFTGQREGSELMAGWLDAIHPDDLAEIRRLWSRSVLARAPYDTEHRLLRADGEWRHMAARAVPILEKEGSVREWVGTHTDITERKRAELELAAARDAAEAANRAKSAFLANMSHELRTPLSAVIGYTEMMEEEIEEMGERGLLGDLGKVKSNARHLLSLINDVLDLSKIEANRMDTYAEDADVALLVREVAATVDSLIRQKDNRIVMELGDALGTMHTDVVKLRQCLFNLLSNASKFTERGRIDIAVRRERLEGGDAVVFRIGDTGVGMTAEQVGRLFQRFSQADETTTRKFGGTGLGLAITRAFCQLLGGTITVESTPGVGTAFTIRLPATMPKAAQGEAPAEAEAQRPGASVETGDRDLVLVIDDDAAQRDLMVRFLERQGFVARTASDGRSGLAAARALRPRAILLDVMMPQMDGWSVLTALKENADLATIPVIMVTFVGETALGTTLGAADHIMKPVDWDGLKTVMDRLRDAEGDILLVDDDPDIRARLRTVLERVGWSVQEAENGLDALAKVAHGPPRAILLDLTMPVMDGFAFLHQLRERPGCRDLPVVVFSARDLSVADRAELGQADGVLSKTASLHDVTSRLRELAPPEEPAPARTGS